VSKTRIALHLVKIAVVVSLGLSALAQQGTERTSAQRPGGDAGGVSPVRGIERAPRGEDSDGPERPPRRRRPSEARAIDGSGNNLAFASIGATGTPLLRLFEASYADGVSSLAGNNRASAREISNLVSAQPFDARANGLGATDFLWQWGQFLDHDIDLSDGVDPPEPAFIEVPAGDPDFDPDGTGEVVIAFNRSIYDPATGVGLGNPRQQLNEITAWIDASNVYGSDEVRAAALRANDGSGRLRENDGGLLPFNEEGLPNAGGSSPSLFLAGDVRANEQVGLIAMHTLFLREHNRVAARIAERHPEWSGDDVYEMARARVGALMQVITYREFLPALLGANAIPPYRGYDPEVDASVANVFSTAAYRFGHSALSSTLLRLDADGNEIQQGHLALADAFFRPDRVVHEGGIEPLLRGLAAQACQAIDPHVVDAVRNFLFGDPGHGGFDLAALNIQRGRDHGLPSYNDAREAMGFPRAEGFEDISRAREIQDRLAAAYPSVDDVDLWVGGLAEEHRPRSHLGPLYHAILVEQFTALRDGDRFWYRNVLSRREIESLEATRLSDVIRRNTTIGAELPDDVFHVPTQGPHLRR
jgi:hypothetical protein